MLAELAARTFTEAFGADNTEADLAAYLSSNFSGSRMARELADPASRFLLVEVGGQLGGYAKLHWGEAPSSVRGPRPVELSRIYVTADHLGHGVGPALMQRCIAEGRESGAATMWLGVWERNARAHAFYRKWGFQRVGEQAFMLGSDPQTDWVMECDLVA